MNRCEKLDSELPECVLSHVFSKLPLKDLVKTSGLSKCWLHEWGLRRDLNFDLDNMFDRNTLKMPKDPVNFRWLKHQFATRLDQFMLHYQGAMIHSIRVNFPLGAEHSDVIGRLVSKGIAKGVEHIELLFSPGTNPTCQYLNEIKPYTFPFTLLSDTDSLTYLSLEKCRLVAPMDFSGFKNLRTLVLRQVHVDQDLIQGLFSNCIYLVDFTLDACRYVSILKIICPTLFHLNIVNCLGMLGQQYIGIIASNLISFQYSSNGTHVHPLNINANMLSKFNFRAGKISKPFGFAGLKNVTTVMLDGLRDCLQARVVPHLFRECLQLEDVTFKNCQIKCDMEISSIKLRHLKIIDCGCQDFSHYIAIDASNLTSFECSGRWTRKFSIVAPCLLNVFWNASVIEENRHSLGPIPRLHQIENLSMVVSHSQIAKLKVLGQFQNLRRLELFLDEAYAPNMGYYLILDVLMASQHLQQLSLTVRNSSHAFGFKSKHARFFRSDLKYVELHGSVCTPNAIEFARHLLRNSNLEKISFDSLDKFYIGDGRWTKGSNGYWFKRNFIHDWLKDELKGQCQLIIS